MSIPTDPPRVTRTTTVANISTTERFPVERSSTGTPPPRTRPVQLPPPAAAAPVPSVVTTGISKAPTSVVTTGISKAPTPLRSSLEAAARSPKRMVPRTVGSPFTSEGPPEGVGAGRPPPGGFKVR